MPSTKEGTHSNGGVSRGPLANPSPSVTAGGLLEAENESQYQKTLADTLANVKTGRDINSVFVGAPLDGELLDRPVKD